MNFKIIYTIFYSIIISHFSYAYEVYTYKIEISKNLGDDPKMIPGKQLHFDKESILKLINSAQTKNTDKPILGELIHQFYICDDSQLISYEIVKIEKKYFANVFFHKKKKGFKSLEWDVQKPVRFEIKQEDFDIIASKM